MEKDHSIKVAKFDDKNLFFEKTNKYINHVKFALPEVRVGSVIDVQYVTESPFLFQFYTWKFQDDIPKIYSEYWAEIPGNWIYNITLRGFQKLNKNETEVVKDCFQLSSLEKSSCMLAKYAMENIPAFKEEKYMTAEENFISAIYFELSEVIRFDGTKSKYAEEWKDVDNKLRQHENFGLQIRRARNLMEDVVKPLIEKEPDQVKKAQIIYEFIKHWYSWNGDYGIYCELEAKKAYEQRKAGVAEINLALVGALQAAELNADPLLISTRDHGLPIKLHPQRSGFNYVAARLKIGDAEFLLDATDDFLPFGVLPMRCLNDQGRIISKEESDWVNLNTKQKQKTVVSMDLKWLPDGKLKGTLTSQFVGYDALDERKKINGKSPEENLKTLNKELHDAEVTNFRVENQEDISKPLIEKMEIEMSGFDETGASTFYFNPFLIGRYEQNPFQSTERLYPVDFGAPVESSYFVSIEIPEGNLLEEAPKSTAFGLPNNGGKCLVNAGVTGNKITLTCIITLTKPIYTSEEYHYLKEFFARVVQIQQSQFVFKKK